MNRHELARLEEWNRSDLEAEARRIGLWAPHRKATDELIRKIRAHHNAPFRRAGRLLRRAANLALELAAPALPAEAEVKAAAPEPAPRSAEPKAEETPAPKRVSARARPVADAELVDEGPSLKDEPMPTRTMAKLLADQGHAQRALAIYRRLLRDAPGDEGLQSAIAKLQGGRQRSPRPAAGSGDDDDAAPASEVVFAAGQGALVVAWHLDGRGRDRALRLFAPPARAVRGRRLTLSSPEPTLRVVVVRPSSSGGIVRQTLDYAASEGRAIALRVPEGSRITASIGLARGTEFVSVAHAAPRSV
ncbi:MAG: hypothetical protein AAF411_18120 [Myxococcota bacterium]